MDSCMQEYLFEHFNEEGHHGFLEDVSITFIDKTDLSEPLKRENGAFRSQYCRQRLRSISRNHGRHVFGQGLWVTIVLIIIIYLQKHVWSVVKYLNGEFAKIVNGL